MRGEEPYFYLGGYAGTGKSTLAVGVPEALGVSVEYASFTGKAALVMRQKGCRNAGTIHSKMYLPEDEEDENGNPKFSLAAESPFSLAELIVVDEMSMVNEELGRDLLSFGVPVLVLGDPFQLPPPKGAGFFTSNPPDFLLTEVHRQARGNPIIDLSMRLREGKGLMYGTYGASRIMGAAEARGQGVGADQILVGKNDTRHAYNAAYRRKAGITAKFPQPGEKLVCLRNDKALNLFNGGLWRVVSSYEEHGPESREPSKRVAGVSLMLESLDEDNVPPRYVWCPQVFFEGNAEAEQEMMRRFRGEAQYFNFGYVLTVHKAQGSQWPWCHIINESFVARDHRSRWMYTALTRASEKMTLVL